MVYFQDIDELRESVERRPINNLEIRPDDELTIRVSAPEQEAALPFNLTKSLSAQLGAGGNVELESYLVSDEGTIEFPVLGTIEVEGLTNIELAEKIRNLLEDDYVKDPIVNVRVLNFEVTVLGEVSNPGAYSIKDDHVTLSKALAMAGDLTINGKRENILVMGEENGEKTYAYLDITKANVVDSPYYNLRQNDVIYVEPKNKRLQSASSLGVASSYLSIISVITSLVLIFTN